LSKARQDVLKAVEDLHRSTDSNNTLIKQVAAQTEHLLEAEKTIEVSACPSWLNACCLQLMLWSTYAERITSCRICCLGLFSWKLHFLLHLHAQGMRHELCDVREKLLAAKTATMTELLQVRQLLSLTATEVRKASTTELCEMTLAGHA
jgi:hypothetical protein